MKAAKIFKVKHKMPRLKDNKTTTATTTTRITTITAKNRTSFNIKQSKN